MNGYYTGKIKVVCGDLMCFPVHAKTLEPLSCGCYDPYAWSDPDPEPISTIGIGEWQDKRFRLLDEQFKLSHRMYRINNY